MRYFILCLLVFIVFELKAEPILWEGEQFRLYTFDENNDRQAELVEYIEQAYDAFEFYFELSGQAITVVAFPDVGALEKNDLEALDIRGKVLPFLIKPRESRVAKQVSDAVTSELVADLGIKVKQTDGVLLVEEVLAPIIKLNGLSGIKLGDQLVGVNGDDLNHLVDLIEWVGDLGTGEAYSLQLVRDNQDIELQGKKLNLQTQIQKKGVNDTDNKTDDTDTQEHDEVVMLGALQHEIGHFLLVAHMGDESYINKNRGVNHADDLKQEITQNYGSLKTPDWLDEMVANMCEGDAVKSIHKRSIRRISDLMPLNKLLTTRHPSMDAIIKSKAYQAKRIEGSKTQTIILTMNDFTDEEKRQILSDTDTFYGSSLLFGEYLYHKGGSHLLKNIIEKTRIGSKDDLSFIEMVRRYKSLGNTIEEVESDFHRFVAFNLGTASES